MAREPHQSAPIRIAGVYLGVGLLWIWLTDLPLVWSGAQTVTGFLVSAGKGTLFVCLSALLVYSLVRRNFRALVRAHALLRAIADGTTDAVFVKDRDGKYLLCNAAGARLVGKSVAEALGRDDTALFDPESAGVVMARDQQVMAGGRAETAEEELTAAGVTRTYLATKAPYHDETGAVAGVIGISRDVTERKRAEELLRFQHALLKSQAEASPDGILVVGAGNRVLSFNRRLLDLWGTPTELATAGDDDPTLALARSRTADPDGFAARVAAIYADADAQSHDEVLLADGRTLDRYSGPVRGATGERFGRVWFFRDITDQKRAESAVRTSEARLRLFIEHVPAQIAMFDRDMRYLHASRRWRSDFGLGDRDLVGQSHYDVFPNLPERWKEVHRRCLAGAVERSDEDRYERADGSVLWNRWETRPWMQADGAISGIIIFSEEITARKSAEQALRDRERLLGVVTGSARVGLVVVNDQYEYLFANEAYAEIFGLDGAEIVGRQVPDLLAAGWSQIRPRLDRALAGERVEYELALPAPPGTGAPRSFRAMYEPRGNDTGAPSVVVVVLEITEQKRAEAAIRESEARFRNVFENAATGIAITDPDGRFLQCNPAYCAVLGRTEDELRAADLPALIHPDDRDENMTLLRRLAAGEIPGYELENRFLHKSGGSMWVHKFVSAIPDETGRTKYLMALVTDVTERRRADQALRESEERLRLALEAGAAGVWSWDAQIGDSRWDDRFHANYGFGADQPRTFEGWIGSIHPDDRPRVLARAEQMLRTPGDDRWEVEFRSQHPQLGVRWHFGLGRAERDAAGGLTRLFGIDLDITERKRAEEALRESEERYRRLVEVLPAGVFVNSGGKIAFCNPGFVRLTGAAAPDELLGKSPFDIFHADDHAEIRTRITTMRETGAAAQATELRIVRPDGRVVPVSSVAAPITGSDPPAILVALSDLSERERSTALLRSVLGSVADSILTIDARGTVRSANPATTRQFGYSEGELVGGNINVLMPEPYHHEHDDYIGNYLRTGVGKVIGIGREVTGRRKDGTTFPLELTVTEFGFDGERRFTGVVRDITARRRLEAQFQQAQKMEAVGRLAGGVAHDFNNLLTVINGYSDLVLDALAAGAPQREFVAAIREAGDRASRLTQQLLAFSRKAVIEPKVLDLNELVAESAKLLRRLIGEDVALAVVPDPVPVRIKADPGQLEQVVMNLAVNARDAMPTGGRLTIETRTVTVEEDDLRAKTGLKPGRYAQLRVADTGQGMTEEVKTKIFEPFFTTKGVGKGTGLGLAVVHGVVEQCGGHIAVDSTVGVGTTFTLLFPVAAEAAAGPASGVVRLAARGTETVLLVEDEDAVRMIARIALTMQGFTVLEAGRGADAIRLAADHPGPIHLLVTDVVMPEMGGRQLAEGVRTHRPGLRVLYMSGYTDDAVVHHGVASTDAFIQKPFTPLGLARKVRAVLDGTA